MAFCKNCGTELKEGAAFCKNCGLKVGDKPPVSTATSKTKDLSSFLNQKYKEFLEKCKTDKRYPVAVGVVAVAVVAMFIIMAVTGQMGKRINIEDCIIVEMSGFDTQGTAYAYLDEETFDRAVVKAKGGKLNMDPDSYEWHEQLDEMGVYALRSLVSLEVENPEGLSNGDEVIVKISYDNDRAKDYDVSFSGDSYSYAVAGLEEYQMLDPFANLSVTFEGVAPDVYVEYEYTGTDGILDTYRFYTDTSYGFNVGDTVTISVDWTEENALYTGYQMTSLSKEYVCENVDTYLEGAEQLTEAALEQMQKDAVDCIEAYFSNNYDYISCGDLNYKGCYVLIAKDSDSWLKNAVYLVETAEVSSKEVYDYSNAFQGIVEGARVFAPRTVYFPVYFENVICKADGTVEYSMDSGIRGSTDLTYNRWSSVAGYTNSEKMYNELAGSRKTDFNIGTLGDMEAVAEEAVAEDVRFILPTSSTEYLSLDDLEGLTQEECRIARNEIYARYGRRFDDEGLQAYFNSQDWYEGRIDPEDFSDDMLNEYETANRDLIVDYETEMGYR